MIFSTKMKRAYAIAKNNPKLLIKKVFGMTWSKTESHMDSWQTHIELYERWFKGELPILYGTPSPVKDYNEFLPIYRAKMAWFELHQKPKYLSDLQLPPTAFKNERVLDIGSGPFPSAAAFSDCELFCLDPIMAEYIRMGFPIHLYESRIKFIHAPAEKIPFPNEFFDAVISVNAIDHVDNFKKTADEIRRVLKPSGKLAMHVHYHKKTRNEPIKLNDRIFLQHYGWCKGLEKVTESRIKSGWRAPKDELYVLWRNF